MVEPVDSAQSGGAAGELFTAVYDRLKAMAGRQLSNAANAPTFSTTVLVHELYLRMAKGEELRFEHPAQFFAYAARAMRHLLADRARDRMRLRAGVDWQKVTLVDETGEYAVDSAEEALRLDAAIARLETQDERAAKVVELRYFAGMSLEQVAEVLGLARRTVDRDWRFARAFLKNELE